MSEFKKISEMTDEEINNKLHSIGNKRLMSVDADELVYFHFLQKEKKQRFESLIESLFVKAEISGQGGL